MALYLGLLVSFSFRSNAPRPGSEALGLQRKVEAQNQPHRLTVVNLLNPRRAHQVALVKAQMCRTWAPTALWLGQEHTQCTTQVTLAKNSRQEPELRDKGDLRPGLAVACAGSGMLGPCDCGKGGAAEARLCGGPAQPCTPAGGGTGLV